MNRKILLGLVLIMLVLCSSLVLAQKEEDPCTGFWGSIKCFFWGNAENRAGKSWFDRTEALVGQVGYHKFDPGDKEIRKSVKQDGTVYYYYMNDRGQVMSRYITRNKFDSGWSISLHLNSLDAFEQELDSSGAFTHTQIYSPSDPEDFYVFNPAPTPEVPETGGTEIIGIGEGHFGDRPVDEVIEYGNVKIYKDNEGYEVGYELSDGSLVYGDEATREQEFEVIRAQSDYYFPLEGDIKGHTFSYYYDDGSGTRIVYFDNAGGMVGTSYDLGRTKALNPGYVPPAIVIEVPYEATFDPLRPIERFPEEAPTVTDQPTLPEGLPEGDYQPMISKTASGEITLWVDKTNPCSGDDKSGCAQVYDSGGKPIEGLLGGYVPENPEKSGTIIEEGYYYVNPDPKSNDFTVQKGLYSDVSEPYDDNDPTLQHYLREILEVSEYEYDEDNPEANIILFQEEAGLDPDGAAGKETIETLNQVIIQGESEGYTIDPPPKAAEPVPVAGTEPEFLLPPAPGYPDVPPPGVSGDAKYHSANTYKGEEGIWTEPPTDYDACDRGDESKCGKVFDATGNEIEGLIWEGEGTSPSPKKGYIFSPDATSSMDVVVQRGLTTDSPVDSDNEFLQSYLEEVLEGSGIEYVPGDNEGNIKKFEDFIGIASPDGTPDRETIKELNKRLKQIDDVRDAIEIVDEPAPAPAPEPAPAAGPTPAPTPAEEPVPKLPEGSSFKEVFYDDENNPIAIHYVTAENEQEVMLRPGESNQKTVPFSVFSHGMSGGYEFLGITKDRTTGYDIISFESQDGQQTRNVEDRGLDDTGENVYVAKQENIETNPDGVKKTVSTDYVVFYGDDESIKFNDRNKDEEGNQIVSLRGDEYVIDEKGWDQDALTCEKGQNCFTPTDPKRQLKRGIYNTFSQVDRDEIVRVETNGNTLIERYQAGTDDTLLWPRKINKVYQYQTDAEGNIDPSKGFTARTTIGTYVTKEFKQEPDTDGDGKANRKYYSQDTYLGFGQKIEAISTQPCSADDLTCELIYIDDDGNMLKFIDQDGDGFPSPSETVTGGKRSYDKETGRLIIEEPVDVEDVCKDGSADCQERLKNTKGQRALSCFAAGECKWQKDLSGVASIMSTFHRWSGISMALCGGDYCYSGEIVGQIDRWFAGSVLSENYWESQVCKAEYADLQSEEGVAFIETPSGTFQAIAHIEAERSAKMALLCEYDEVEGEYCIEEDMECIEGLCYYKDNDDEPAEGYMYKITWGVASPADEEFTPYVDENGIAVSFNIVLADNIPLYNYQGNERNPLKLINGDRDGAMVVHWSANDYEGEEACIVWTQAPLSVSQPGVRAETATYGAAAGSYIIPDICTGIEESSRGTIDTMTSSSSGRGFETSGTSTTSSDEGTSMNTDW